MLGKSLLEQLEEKQDQEVDNDVKEDVNNNNSSKENNGRVYIKIDLLLDHPKNHYRRHNQEIKTMLTESIKAVGILQDLLITPVPGSDDFYILART